MSRIRLTANMIWLVVFSIGITAGAFLSFATGFLFDDSYPVVVTISEAGGLFPDQEVTVLGHAVGVITAVDVVEGGVRVEMKIQGDQQVPADSRLQVLRRSPIGEQVLDFQPSGPDWTPVLAGAEMTPTEVVVPAEVPFLLEKSAAFLAAVDAESINTILHELALGIGGKGQDLRDLGVDSLDLNRTLVGGIPEFERLIDTSEAVLRLLENHTGTLTHALVEGADVLDILADQQPNFERLLDTGVRTVVQADALIRNERANLECLTRDLDEFNQLLLGPSTATGEPAAFYDSKLDELEMLLQKNQAFYRGFDIAGQYDVATGARWARIALEAQEQGGVIYAEERATPATKPGAACQTTAFGTGVNAVRQPVHQPADPTSPGIDYAPLVEARGSQQQDPPPSNRPPLPATGGGLAIIGLAAAFAASRRRRA